MFKKLFLLVIILFFMANAGSVFAACIPHDGDCGGSQGYDCCPSDGSYQCMPDLTGTQKNQDGSPKVTCQEAPAGKAFGLIKVPAPLAGFLKNNPTGASAISQFLSNFVALLFSIAAIVLIFMILWGAFEWLTSGGDKEKLSSAQKRIINAFIGILLFAVAFAIIRVLGVFTGFTFFKGQGVTILEKRPDGTYMYKCPGDDVRVYVNKELSCP